MSDNLISRRAVINIIKRHGLDIDMSMERVAEISTAYDVDKVVERLQTELSLADEEKERCLREAPLQFDTAKGYAHAISVALEIVKSGGVTK